MSCRSFTSACASNVFVKIDFGMNPLCSVQVHFKAEITIGYQRRQRPLSCLMNKRDREVMQLAEYLAEKPNVRRLGV